MKAKLFSVLVSINTRSISLPLFPPPFFVFQNSVQYDVEGLRRSVHARAPKDTWWCCPQAVLARGGVLVVLVIFFVLFRVYLPSLPSPFCLSLSRHHRPSSLPLPLAITRPNPLPFLDRATPHPYAYAYAYAYARLHSHPHLLSHAHPRYNACTMHVQCTADNFEWKTPAFGKKRYLWIEIQMEYEYAVVRRWRRYHSLLHCCCCCLGHLLSSPHIWSI